MTARPISDARLTILGTGTSSGVPAIGCECRVCTSGDPRDRRSRTAGALQFIDAGGQSRCILLDCGPDHREQALRAKLTRADEILVTHAHVDHVWGLDETRRYNVMQHGPIRLTTDAPTLQSLRTIYAHILGGDPGPNGDDSWVAEIETRDVRPDEPFNCFGLRVTAVELLHGRMSVLGFRIDAPEGTGGELFPLAWCTDVSEISAAAAEALAGVRTLVLDALRDRPHPTHFTIAQAVEAAGRLGAGRTILVHLAHDLTHEELLARLPEGISPGFDGQVLN
ncbi:MAG: MBL fold metallo-hydrolase [Planctomycetota bacterium]|nr:MBL fold metallo-hydrolase [Planctomycetota bacterium]